MTSDQITYAATDAWISRELYVRFEKSGFAAPAVPNTDPELPSRLLKNAHLLRYAHHSSLRRTKSTPHSS